MKTLTILQRKSAPPAYHYGQVMRMLLLVLIGTFCYLTPINAQTAWDLKGNTVDAGSLLGTKNNESLKLIVNSRQILEIMSNSRIKVNQVDSNLLIGDTYSTDKTLMGTGNTSIGTMALFPATLSMARNTAIGYRAFGSAQPTYGVAIGNKALINSSGYANIGIGNEVGSGLTGDNNLIIGDGLGYKMNGSNNILIGADGGIKNSSGSFTPASQTGSNRLNIGNWIYGNNGNIGIGASNPIYKLEVSGKVKLTDTLIGTKAKFSGLAGAAAVDSVVMVDNAGNLHKKNAAAFISTSIWSASTNNAQTKGTQFNGNVGIGVASPVYKLEVAGKAKLADTLFGTRAKLINLDRAAATDSIVMVDNAGNLHKRNAAAFTPVNIWSTAANNAQTKGAQFDGNIGIGTASPAYKLDIVGKAKLTDTLFGTKARFSGLASATVADSIVMVDNAGNLHKRNAAMFTGSNIWSASANNTQIKGAQFNGNVGIGTASPLYKLDIVGKAKLTDTLIGTKAKFTALATGDATDNLVTVDNSGNLRKLDATTLSSWSLNSSKQLYTNLPLAIGTGKNGSHANATQPGTVLTINGRTHIGKADGSDASWVNYDQSASVKDFLLYVQKGIITEDIGIATAGNSDWTWSDFVFEKGYRLRPLTEVEKYINANKHLPEIPSTKEIGKSGYSLNKMNSLFLQKIEELTLYSIAQEKLAKEQETVVKTQQEKIKQLEEKMEKVLSLLAQKGNQK